jgi:hypothetical protein
MSAATDATGTARKALHDWKPAFLQALEVEGTVFAACHNAGICRSTAYRMRQRDEQFALQWADVESKVTDKLERKAVELALGGDTKMLEFLLKARRPDTYRENMRLEQTIQVTTNGGAMVEDPELAKEGRELLRRAAGTGGDVAGGAGGSDQ